MFNFKIPITGGIIGFVLIFIINIARGNSFFVVLLRSVIYGGIVFGIIFGMIYLFKNILKIEIDGNTTALKENESESEVDVTVGDENDTFDEESGHMEEKEPVNNQDGSEMNMNDEIGNQSDFNTDSGENHDFSSAPISGHNDQNAEDQDSDDYSPNEDYKTASETTSSSANGKDPGLDIDVNNFNMDNIGTDETAFELGSQKEKEIINDNDHLAKIKSKIGQDTSFEDLAKAIRTKLKSDK